MSFSKGSKWLMPGSLLAGLLFWLGLTGCGWVEPGDFQDSVFLGDGRKLVIWMLSDIQPPIVAHHVDFEQAILDVKRNIDQVDIGIIAGDLLKSRASDEEFRWFLETRSRSRVAHWYEIAGNHDMRSQPRFSRYFPKPDHYAVRVGNLLLLFLSDTSTDSASHIPDRTFQWWRRMVRDNQDSILITVSHAQLRHSGLIASMVPSRRIVGSERFEEVLRNYRVDLWASGHTHLPQSWAGTANCVPELSDSCFVNVSSIARKPFAGSQSRFLYLKVGSSSAWLRSRSHNDQKFNPRLDLPLQLSHRFRWNGEKPQLILDADSPET